MSNPKNNDAKPKSASDIEHDIRRVLTRMKFEIESAEMHLKAGTPPLTVSFILWYELRKWEATLKAHDPKPNAEHSNSHPDKI